MPCNNFHPYDNTDQCSNCGDFHFAKGESEDRRYKLRGLVNHTCKNLVSECPNTGMKRILALPQGLFYKAGVIRTVSFKVGGELEISGGLVKGREYIRNAYDVRIEE